MDDFTERINNACIKLQNNEILKSAKHNKWFYSIVLSNAYIEWWETKIGSKNVKPYRTYYHLGESNRYVEGYSFDKKS